MSYLQIPPKVYQAVVQAYRYYVIWNVFVVNLWNLKIKYLSILKAGSKRVKNAEILGVSTRSGKDFNKVRMGPW